MQFKTIPILLCCMTLLTGCLGQKNIQDLTYVIAFGIDYDEINSEIIVKTLALDFTNVAKIEGAKPSPPPPEWIGEGRGRTVEEAISMLYQNSQPDLYLQHIKTIILSEKAIQNKFSEINESIGRSNMFRFSVNIFSTNTSIDEIFRTKALFFYPQTSTILNKPKREVGSTYILSPKSYREFLSEYYEPLGATYIPSLDISDKNWKKNNKKYPLLKINGAHFFEKQEYKGFLPENKVLGLRWLDEEKKKNTFILEKKEEQKRAVVRVSTSKLKVKVLDQVKPTFEIKVHGYAELLENPNNMSQKEIIEGVKELIKNEVIKSYKEGLLINSDVFRLGTRWFREYGFYTISNLKDTSKKNYLQEDSIKRINISINIRSTDNFKSKTHSDVFDTKSIYK